MMKTILQPFSEQHLGDLLKAALGGEDEVWNAFQAAVAFAKRSGVQHIEDELRGFVDRGGYVRMMIGIDRYGTSIEGLSGLLRAINDKGEIWINHDRDDYVTFHPKLYLFESKSSALLIVGSGNLTEGGLYTNDEASLAYELDLSNQDDQMLLREVKEALDSWCDDSLASVKRLDENLLKELIDADYIRPEAKSRVEDDAEEATSNILGKDDSAKLPIRQKGIFGRGIVRRSPTKYRKKSRKKRIPEDDQLKTSLVTTQPPDIDLHEAKPTTYCGFYAKSGIF